MGIDIGFYAGYGVALKVDESKTSLKLLTKAYNDNEIEWQDLPFEYLGAEFQNEFPGLQLNGSYDYMSDSLTPALIVTLNSTTFHGDKHEPWDLTSINIKNAVADKELKQLTAFIERFKITEQPSFLIWSTVS